MLIQIKKADYDRLINLQERFKQEIIRLREDNERLRKNAAPVITIPPVDDYENFLGVSSNIYVVDHDYGRNDVDTNIIIKKDVRTVDEKLKALLATNKKNPEVRVNSPELVVISTAPSNNLMLNLPNHEGEEPLIFEQEATEVAQAYNPPDVMDEIRKNYKHPEGPVVVVDDVNSIDAAFEEMERQRFPQADEDKVIHLRRKLAREENDFLDREVLKKQVKQEFWNT